MNIDESIYLNFMHDSVSNADPAHDILHIERVVSNAKYLLSMEGGKPNVVVPSAWLHDCVVVDKSSPLRSSASRLSAEKAISFLQELNYGETYLEDISHCIEAHSFSAGIKPRTLEAMIVQDADRLDSLGWIGIVRCIQVGAALGKCIYSKDDPFCSARVPDDGQFTIDHFFTKLFKIPATMNTETGKKEAEIRAQRMRNFLSGLRDEIGFGNLGPYP